MKHKTIITQIEDTSNFEDKVEQHDQKINDYSNTLEEGYRINSIKTTTNLQDDFFIITSTIIVVFDPLYDIM